MSWEITFSISGLLVVAPLYRLLKFGTVMIPIEYPHILETPETRGVPAILVFQ